MPFNLLSALMKRIYVLLILTLSIGLAAPLHAQAVLVSEYYNMSDPANGEWNELIVVQDNLDMRGMFVSDNNTPQSARQGGVRFKNIDMWKNVRAGTIIGIWHRNYPTNTPADSDGTIADGRVMLAASDVNFFDQVQFVSGNPWTFNCFNLSRTGDFIEVFNKDTVHIHAIGHKEDASPGPYWAPMPIPKINLMSLCEDKSSHRVYPGSSLAEYTGPNLELRSQACSTFVTRTLPNKDCSTGASNATFWHSLRQPSWTAPALATVLSSNQVLLSWNLMTDPNPADATQGYLVVRDSGTSAFSPVDGRIYKVGERVGSAVVLANLGSQVTSFADNIDLPCGVIYTYRVFAYRYGQDDEYGVNTPSVSTRGRQYNRDGYAFHEALKQAAVGPTLQYASGQNTFCEGSSLTIQVPPQSGYTAQWMLNGSPLSGETGFSVIARQSGQYRLKLTNAQGCLVLSDSVDVLVHALPTVELSPKALILCKDSSTIISATPNADYSYQWFLNGTAVSGATDASINTTQSGDFTVKVTNKLTGCSNTSGICTVKSLVQALSISTNSLVFADLADCVSYADNNSSVQLSNPSTSDTLVVKVVEAAHFTIVSPSFPLSLAPGKSVQLVIRFNPNSTAAVSESMSFITAPCGVTQDLTLKARKPGLGVGLSSDVSAKDFGTIAWCSKQSVTDSVFLTVSQNTIVSSIVAPAPFSISAADQAGFSMKAGETRGIHITFNSQGNPLQVGKKDMVVNFTAGVCTDSIKINLRGSYTLPQLLVDLNRIDFGTLDSCSRISKDTVISVTNPSSMDITLNQLSESFINIVEVASSGPMIIPAGATVKLTLRFSPVGYSGYNNKSILFNAKPCLDPSGLVIDGTRSGISVSATRDSLDFGDVNFCGGVSGSSQNTALVLLSINNASAQVSDVRFSSNLFTTDLSAGKTLQVGSNAFSVSLNPAASPSLGTFKETMFITLQPCDVQQQIVLTGRVVGQNILIENSTEKDTVLEFGTVDVGSSLTRIYTLRNNSSFPITLGSVPFTNGMYAISTQPAPGSTVSPGQTVTVTVVFNPTAAGTATGSFDIPIGSPCVDTLSCMMHGVGRAQGTSPERFHFEIGDHSASVGDNITIPINIRGSNVAGRALSSATAVFAYNTSLLKINNVTLGPALSGFTTSFGVVQNGITLRATNGSVLTDTGRAFDVHATVLLGDALSTPLFIDTSSISISSTELSSESPKNGSLTIQGSCVIANRTVKLSGGVGLTILRENASAGTLDLGYETVGEQHTRIEVYNLLGECIATPVDQVTHAGVHEVQLPTFRMAQGSYVIVMSSGISRHSLMIDLVR